MFSELVLAASKDSDSINIYDFRLGTSLGSLNSISTDTQYSFLLSPLSNSNESIPWVLAVSNSALTGFVYNLTLENKSCKLKFPLPEKISCITISPSGTYIFGGSFSGKIYCWIASTGSLLRVWEAHYGPVTCLLTSADESVILSAGEDANTHVWLLTRTLDIFQSELPTPEVSFSEHTMPVTSIYISSTGTANRGFMNSRPRVFTGGMDQSVKCWEIGPKYNQSFEKETNKTTRFQFESKLLTTWLLPSALKSIVLDKMETKLFCGCQNGVIYRLDLYLKKSQLDVSQYYAVGGKGLVIEVDQSSNPTGTDSSAKEKQPTIENSPYSSNKFVGHEKSISSISLSIDDRLLVSGSADNTVKVWDIYSGQCIRTLNASQKQQKKAKPANIQKIATMVDSGISQVTTFIKPPALGGASASLRIAKGGENVTFGSNFSLFDPNIESLNLNKADNMLNFSQTTPSNITILNRIPISASDPVDLLDNKDSKDCIKSSLYDAQPSLYSISRYFNPTSNNVSNSSFSPQTFSSVGDIAFSIQSLEDSFSLKTEESLREQITKLHEDVSEIASRYEKLVDLNTNLYNFTVNKVLSSNSQPLNTEKEISQDVANLSKDSKAKKPKRK
ncbi:hypothetical protein BB560_002418 [Smittium megazygosporum]|uniref:Anaphase-promoting complex subunit 4 WD40 domain-containing protein n=1 Tax=Smittium megazygosporum TaxID=133381 RepID=A0A2T9ZEX7_9FUNG|nr:hypothetical protein BB560_002418 [Smittium megazygosporum]